MKVVTLYTHKSYGSCGYKYKGKLYGFMHTEHERKAAELVTTPAGFMATPHPSDFEYTGKRYVFK